MIFNLIKTQQYQTPQNTYIDPGSIQEALAQLAMRNIIIEPGTSPEQIIEMAEKNQNPNAGIIVQKAKENAKLQQGIGENIQDIQNIEPGVKVQKQKLFNLKKAQNIYEPPLGEPVLPGGDMAADTTDILGDQLEEEQMPGNIDDSPKFRAGDDLKHWLDQNDRNSSRSLLFNYIEDPNTQQRVDDELARYYEEGLSSNDRLHVAVDIYNVLPEALKFEELSEETLSAPYISAQVKRIEENIKKLAKNTIKKNKKNNYNLKKEAQHKVVEDAIVYGPEQVRIDPYYHKPVSDYHIVERNKGYGIDFGGIWDLDWEVVWRNTIMDKYSRPYKDKNGNWVGGYIQKRFEVDKNIPEQNNLQLKPGQKRRPILPQYGNLESRMTYMRANEDRGYAPNSSTTAPTNWNELTTTPFNLKQASTTKKKS